MNKQGQTKDIQAVLNSFYQNVGEKNAEGMVALCAEQIDWYIAKSDFLPWTGKRKSKADIKEALNLLFNAHVDGEDQFEPGHIFIDGQEAAVFGFASRVAKATGKRFSTQFCQRFTIEDGKISKFLMLEDTPQVEKAFK
ncbi:nuclear transport factor 2 family protein [Mucilaginibacter aquariorum]|uniref:Nuclear transport factor 2 family protein n=1 Tax=Mucilaginibacter aquariorum TaxID=2967225 RepID=A0ABT1T1Q9_9SPHI|nr:nuclear transport factor 2 family protein [Mucilaginibacter aquariorum]MCQ6958393.1 nuclear transport factor 2 family protein [Mucilaginibacter aquariorum]